MDWRRVAATHPEMTLGWQWMQWTSATNRPYFALIVHHTDAEREVAYDRDSVIGKLDKALDEAKQKGWTFVDMKKDWKRVFPFEK